MVISEFSKITGISAYTLRYYEKKGLLRVARDTAGRRDYSGADIEWVKFIKRLKDTGMLLRDIQHYSGLRYEGDATMEERMELLIRHRKSVVAERDRWEGYLRNLDEKICIYKEKIKGAQMEMEKCAEEPFSDGARNRINESPVNGSPVDDGQAAGEDCVSLQPASCPAKVAGIVETTVKAVYPRYYPSGAVHFFLELHKEQKVREAMDGEEVYLAVVQGKAVGTGSIRKNEICRLFILPEYQGRGYGSRVMDLLEGKVFRQYQAVHIDASFPAEGMYLKRGYRIASYEKIETGNGDMLCYHTMEKQKGSMWECGIG